MPTTIRQNGLIRTVTEARALPGTPSMSQISQTTPFSTPAVACLKRAISGPRPRWLDKIAEVVGGRACLSRIRLDLALPPACAVSSPARLATKGDRLGACVITVIDDGMHASITACGSGLAGTPDDAADLIDALLDELRRVG